MDISIKGTVARIYFYLGFFTERSHLSPRIIFWDLFVFGFKFTELFEFEVWLPATLIYAAGSQHDIVSWKSFHRWYWHWNSPICDFFTWLFLSGSREYSIRAVRFDSQLQNAAGIFSLEVSFSPPTTQCSGESNLLAAWYDARESQIWQCEVI